MPRFASSAEKSDKPAEGVRGMSLKNGKCPSCGANIQVDTGLESAFCSYCGSKIEPKTAVAKMKLELS
jgi:DNA-directed RNA polymerase subunit RPC12/RpoP